MFARFLALFAAPLFLLLAVGCHHSSGPTSFVSASNSTASVTTSSNVVANGIDSTTLTVTVVDNQGMPLAGVRVEPSASGSNNVFVPPTGVTDANGVFQADLSSITAEEKTITVRVLNGASTQLDDLPTVAFIGDANTVDAALSSAIANPAVNVVADGTTTSAIVVTARDINGNPVPGQAVEVATDGTNNTLVQPLAVTDAAGEATATLATTTAELKTITATINPLATPIVVTQQATAGFVGDVNNLDLSASSAMASPASGLLADGLALSTVSVILLDANGNTVPGADIQLVASGAGNTLMQPGLTDAAGSTSGTLASTTAETKTVTVVVNSAAIPVQLTDQPTVEFVANPAAISATLSTIAANPASGITADGVATTTLTVTVRDANGNPVSGQAVELSANGTGNTLVQPAAVTDALGEASGTLASTVAETKTVGATINPLGTPVALVNTASVTFAPAVSASMSSASASPTSGIAANGGDFSTVTVTLRDAGGNPLAGRAVTIAANGSGNVIAQPMALTNASGVTTATLASTTAESKTITITGDPVSSPTVLSDQPMVTFDPVVVDPALSTVTVTPSFGALADGTEVVTMTVTVRDAMSTPLAGQAVQWTASGSGNTLTPSSGTTDSSGEFEATLATTIAEAKTFVATVNPGASEVVLNDQPSAEFVWPIPNAWFVRTTGNNSNSGTGPAKAFATLGAAALVAQAGDTIFVGAGTYAGLVDITTGGSVGDPIRWFADSDGEFTQDSGAVVIDAMAADYGMRLMGAAFVLIEGFEFVGAGNPAVGAIDVVGAADNAILRNNRIYNNVLGIRIDTADNATIEDNSISNNSSDGVLLQAGADNAGVTNNLVYNNGGSGVRADGVLGLSVALNTLYLNAGDQLRAEGGTALTAGNNIVIDGLADGIVQNGVGTVVITDFNDSFGHSAGSNWQGVAQGAGDISVDALLQDPDGVDNLLGGANGADDRLHVDSIAPSLTLDTGTGNAGAIVLSSGDTGSDRTTRSDDLLDGEAPDGPLVNMGFHYAPNIEPLGPLEVDDGRLFYGEGSSSRPRVRDWDDSASSWGTEEPTAPAATLIQYAVHEQSIIADGEEYLVILSTDGSSSDLEMLTWTGTKWRREWSTPAIDAANADKRGFDFGFEQSSAHGLIVYSDNSPTPVYRTRENGLWSDALSLPLNDGAGGSNPDPNTGVVSWVELVEKPGSDEVTLLYADANSDLVVVVWDGSAWVAASVTVLETSMKTNPISNLVHNRAFDGAYESLSGDFLCTWGRESAAGFYWSSRAAGGFTFTGAANVFSQNGNTHYCDLASEPGTDRIAGGFYDLGDGTERLGLSTWDGAAWQNTVELDSQILDVNDMGSSDFSGEVAWLGTTGTAVCVYPDNQSGTLDWATWTAGGGWVLGADLVVTGKGTGESAFLRSFPNQDRVMAVFSDSNGALYSATFDGTTWTLTNGGAPLETNLSTISAAPFSFAFER